MSDTQLGIHVIQFPSGSKQAEREPTCQNVSISCNAPATGDGQLCLWHLQVVLESRMIAARDKTGDCYDSQNLRRR